MKSMQTTLKNDIAARQLSNAANQANTSKDQFRMSNGVRVIDYTPAKRHAAPSNRYYLWLILPAVIVLACITLYPFFWLIWMSFHKVDMMRGDIWNNFANWRRLLSDRSFGNGWYLLIKYSAMCMIMEVGLGVLLAVILNRSKYEKASLTRSPDLSASAT